MYDIINNYQGYKVRKKTQAITYTTFSIPFYLASAVSMGFVIYYLNKKLIHKEVWDIPTKEKVIAFSCVLILAFLTSVFLLAMANAAVRNRDREEITGAQSRVDDRDKNTSCCDNDYNLGDLLLLWCICGPRCGDTYIINNGGVSGNDPVPDDGSGVCVMILAIVGSVGILVGYLAYLVKTIERISNYQDDSQQCTSKTSQYNRSSCGAHGGGSGPTEHKEPLYSGDKQCVGRSSYGSDSDTNTAAMQGTCTPTAPPAYSVDEIPIPYPSLQPVNSVRTCKS